MTTLVVPEVIADALAAMARTPVESAGVLLVGVAAQHHDVSPRLLAREFVEIPEASYLCRTSDSLVLSSSSWVPALSRAGDLGAAAIFVHTHPGGGALERSDHDRIVDEELYDPFTLRTGSDFYGSLILGSTSDGALCFTGHIWKNGRAPREEAEGDSIDRMWTVGRRLSLTGAADRRTVSAPSPQFDRQIRAFGGDVQEVLGSLHVGVAGAGGTGSAVLEQLVRLGVRRVTVVDPDTISGSNVTRVYGSGSSSIGTPKVSLQAAHLAEIASDIDLRAVRMKTTDREAAQALSGCDLVFGCTDDDAGRIVLSRLSSYYLIPVIDCGVLLSSEAGEIRGIYGRVTTMVPGAACMLCRNRVDVARAGAELMSDEQRQARQAEGYAPELGDREPAVVAYTSLVASLAVSEMLERLIGFGQDVAPTELLARIHDRELSTNTREPNTGHFCDPGAGLLGSGDTEPLLHWSWSNESS